MELLGLKAREILTIRQTYYSGEFRLAQVYLWCPWDIQVEQSCKQWDTGLRDQEVKL